MFHLFTYNNGGAKSLHFKNLRRNKLMRATVEVILSIQELDILKKALSNYIGKLNYLDNKVDSLEEIEKLKAERKLAGSMLHQIF